MPPCLPRSPLQHLPLRSASPWCLFQPPAASVYRRFNTSQIRRTSGRSPAVELLNAPLRLPPRPLTLRAALLVVRCKQLLCNTSNVTSALPPEWAYFGRRRCSTCPRLLSSPSCSWHDLFSSRRPRETPNSIRRVRPPHQGAENVCS